MLYNPNPAQYLSHVAADVGRKRTAITLPVTFRQLVAYLCPLIIIGTIAATLC
jgi:hypothetical protein